MRKVAVDMCQPTASGLIRISDRKFDRQLQKSDSFQNKHLLNMTPEVYILSLVQAAQPDSIFAPLLGKNVSSQIWGS